MSKIKPGNYATIKTLKQIRFWIRDETFVVLGKDVWEERNADAIFLN